MTDDEMKQAREEFDKWWYGEGYTWMANHMHAMAILAWLQSWQTAQPKWQPIETLELHKYEGYAVSNNVLLAIKYKHTNIKIGRVWEEKGVRSLPDNKYDDYSLVTHWMPLPNPPEGTAP